MISSIKDTTAQSNFSFGMEAYDNLENVDLVSLKKAISENFKLLEENLKALQSVNIG